MPDMARVARALRHETPGEADWWPQLAESCFSTGPGLCGADIATFGSLAAATGYAASLAWASAKGEPPAASRGLREMADAPATRRRGREGLFHVLCLLVMA